jgi:hypothetical protein
MNEFPFDERYVSASRAGTLRRVIVAVATMIIIVIAVLWYAKILAPAPGRVPPTVLTTSMPLPTLTPLPTPVPPAIYATLAQRPYRFPAVHSIAACPTSPSIVPNGTGLGQAMGTRPIALSVPTHADGTVVFTPASQWGDGIPWGGTPSAFWIAAPGVAGPYLARGMRLDASGAVTFVGDGLALTSTLMTTVEMPMNVYQIVGQWYIRFQAHGCYGIQIDTLDTTEDIIFRA